MTKRHVVITANAAWNLWNYRTGLIRALQADGCRVTLLAPQDETVPMLEALDCAFVPIKMTRRGRIPHTEASVLQRLTQALRQLKPDAVLSFTIKNNLYAGIACRWLGVPFFPNVSGRGAIFTQPRLMVRGVVMAYRLAFGRATTVFYQNPEDRDFFLNRGIGSIDRTALLPGSGIDLTNFGVAPLPGDPNAPVFVMVARLLKDKGVREYAEAAEKVKVFWPKGRFRVVGAHESSDDYVSGGDLAAWINRGLLEYPGIVSDIRPELLSADAVVLPSYYLEGTPRALIEATAMGRPIVTTNTPGCRDTVVDGETGFLVSPRNAYDLTRALQSLCEIGPEKRQLMGTAARRLAEERFDERIVIQSYLRALSDCLYP